jgi:S-adenosylmethionine:tRNA ribosyltransferase-isomerase
MIAAARAPGPRTGARLLVIDAERGITSRRREDLGDLLHPGDLLIANDAATMPASLAGTHERTGRPVEIRLAGRPSLRAEDVHRFTAIAFGAGDWHIPTELRPPPPPLLAGDRLLLGPLRARITRTLDHPRLVELDFEADPAAVWAGIAAHGHPIQYAHVAQPLALWHVWTAFAARPVAFESPSAGFSLSWRTLALLEAEGVAFATLTHAAGISSTGDPVLDARLPFDEPYHIPVETVRALRHARGTGGRVIAVGTTVVRALEHAALSSGVVRAGQGTATQRIGPETRLRVVDGILSGVHEPSTSHYQLLRAFVDDATLEAAGRMMEAESYRSHEFGDSMLCLSPPPGNAPVMPITSNVALRP